MIDIDSNGFFDRHIPSVIVNNNWDLQQTKTNFQQKEKTTTNLHQNQSTKKKKY